MAKKNNKKSQNQNNKTATQLSVFVEEPVTSPDIKEPFDYGTKEIHNPDFYNAYNELLTEEKKYPSFSTFKNRLEEVKGNRKYEYTSSFRSQLDSYRAPIQRKIAYHTNWALKVDTRKTNIIRTCREQIKRAIIVLWIGFIFLVILISFLDMIISYSKEYSRFSKWVLIAILEVIVIFISVKLYNRFMPAHKAKKLIETNPYYQMASELLYIPSYKVQFEFPTKRIDSNYKRYKNNIELEWNVSSHNFITDTFFRFEPFNCRFPDYGFFRFFVEIKYEPCFPDYPELLSIEKQITGLSFISKNNDKPKASIGLFKSQIRDRIKELIKDRIPKMVVTNIVIAVGVLNHNPKNKKDNYVYDSSFKDTYKDPVWKTASWREMIRKKDNSKDDPKDNKIIPAKDIENTDPPVL